MGGKRVWKGCGKCNRSFHTHRQCLKMFYLDLLSYFQALDPYYPIIEPVTGALQRLFHALQPKSFLQGSSVSLFYRLLFPFYSSESLASWLASLQQIVKCSCVYASVCVCVYVNACLQNSMCNRETVKGNQPMLGDWPNSSKPHPLMNISHPFTYIMCCASV